MAALPSLLCASQENCWDLCTVATPNRQHPGMLTHVGEPPVLSFHMGVSMLCMAAGHSPTILVIRDSSGFVFGAYCSEHWRVAPRYQQPPMAAIQLPVLQLSMTDISTVHAPASPMPLQHLSSMQVLWIGGDLCISVRGETAMRDTRTWSSKSRPAPG